MKIERIRVKNFRCLQNVDLQDLPAFAVFIGENGAGKSTLFKVFGFLKKALKENIRTALYSEGGVGGYKEVVSRGHGPEPIEIEIQFRMEIVGTMRLVTYILEINENSEKGPVVQREVLRYKRGRHGSPYHFLDFRDGKGFAINNEEDFKKPDEELKKEEESLESPDILAIKGLGQFQRFKAAAAFRNLIEKWHVSDFHITAARQNAEAGIAQHLSENGNNLPLVTDYLYQNHREVFDKIIEKFRERIPGMESVKPHQTEDGQVLLRFKDGSFEKSFIARYVSDGTIKMFAYLVLLQDPEPHPFLCVEEPENQLYPKFMGMLAEELRGYTGNDRQVFVATHSPDFLNHVKLEEAFFMRRKNGKTVVKQIKKDEQIARLIAEGDQLGDLWNQGLIEESK